MMSYTTTRVPENNNRTVDGGNLHLRDIHPQPHQGICADMIATLENLAAKSWTRWQWSRKTAHSTP